MAAFLSRYEDFGKPIKGLGLHIIKGTFQEPSKKTDGTVNNISIYFFSNPSHFSSGECAENFYDRKGNLIEIFDGLDSLRKRFSRKGIEELVKDLQDPSKADTIPQCFKNYCLFAAHPSEPLGSSTEAYSSPALWKNNTFFQAQYTLYDDSETFIRPGRRHSYPEIDVAQYGAGETLEEKFFNEKAFFTFARAISLLKICREEFKAIGESQKVKFRLASLDIKSDSNVGFHLDTVEIIQHIVRDMAAQDGFTITIKKNETYYHEEYFHFGKNVKVILTPNTASYPSASADLQESNNLGNILSLESFQSSLFEPEEKVHHDLIATATKHPEFLSKAVNGELSKEYEGLYPVHIMISRASPALFEALVKINPSSLYFQAQNSSINCSVVPYLISVASKFLSEEGPYTRQNLKNIFETIFTINPKAILVGWKSCKPLYGVYKKHLKSHPEIETIIKECKRQAKENFKQLRENTLIVRTSPRKLFR